MATFSGESQPGVIGQPPVPPPPTLVWRVAVGGPHRGKRLKVPEDAKRVDCGWMTGWYELQKDGRLRFLSMADMKPGEREEAFFCGCGWEGKRSELRLPGNLCPKCGTGNKLLRKIGG